MASILLTGVSGYVGSALVPRLAREGHELRGMTRDPDGRARAAGIPLVRADAVAGRGLRRALAGIEVAYYLIHSMEPSGDGGFAARERAGAENFAAAARRAGVRRVIYLGGPMPSAGRLSRHLASRLAVEEILLGASEETVAFRASIVIGARSRSFRFLVRLVERMPVLAIPSWGRHRSSPVDERDAIELLARAATSEAIGGVLSLDMRGPEIVSYRELIERIVEAMLITRPSISLQRLSLTPVASRVAAAIAGEQVELIEPLMESLEDDLLPRDDRAARLLGVRLHSLDAAIEHALGEWEAQETLRAR
jgi:uncharacterized protein YbjT (DUF2867 family)